METLVEGIVVATSGNMAKVKIARHSDCESCGSCAGNASLWMEVQNLVHAQVGQRVQIENRHPQVVRAAFIVYMLPLMLSALGAAFGLWLGQQFMLWENFLGGTFGCVFFLFSIRIIRKQDSLQEKNQEKPVIVKIVSQVTE